MRLFQKILLFSYLVLLPVQLNLHFWPSWSFIYGARIDYLSPALFLTDFIFITLLFISLWRGQLRLGKAYFVLGLVIFINILFSALPPVSFYRGLRIMQAFLLFVIIGNTKNAFNIVRSALMLAAFWVSLLALLQVVAKGSVGGVFYWLGERPFLLGNPGIAKFFIFDKWFLRPYSTFGHPNALSGFLGATIMLLIPFKKKYEYVILAFVATAVLFAFSQTVWVAFLLALLINNFKPKKLTVAFSPFFLSFVLVWVSHSYYQELVTYESLVRRAFLNLASINLFSRQIWSGAGLGSFVIFLPQIFKDLSSFVNDQVFWWLQPVHNIYLLVLAEAGLLGTSALFFGIYKIVTKRLTPAFVFILITGLFDHYWFTLQQNLMLLAVVVAITIKGNET